MRRRELLKATAGLAAAMAASPAFPIISRADDLRKSLKVTRRTLEVNGKAASVFGLEQSDGTRGLRFKSGDRFNVLLENSSGEDTIIHWHGLTPPWHGDGVANAPLPLIKANEQRVFDFPVGPAGTHWMHAHTLQEQALLAAPLIVEDADGAGRDEQDVVILLHDFSFKSPEELLSELTKNNIGSESGEAMPGMDHGNMKMDGMTAQDSDMSGMDMGAEASAMDLNDIEYDAYLANDRTLDDPEIVDVERGGKVRLRIINGATATAFTIDLGELEGELTAVDGQNVAPIKGRRFPLTMGQRADITVTLPDGAKSYPVLALREGGRQRTGVILRPVGAKVAMLEVAGADLGPVLNLDQEGLLIALSPLNARSADRTFNMSLTGDMNAYKWGLETDRPIEVRHGERVEITMQNTSMMAHPMHLHGHRFQVVAIDGNRINGAVRDTVLIPPSKAITIAVDADNPGQWAFHCHHIYHMATGMMSSFAYVT